MKSQHPLLIFLLLSGFSLTILAQTSGNNRFFGVVYDSDTGEPIEGVTVKLFSSLASSWHPTPAVTNKEGKWKALYLRGGIWTLTFEKVGYLPEKISLPAESSPGAKQPILEVKLRRIKNLTLRQEVIAEIEKGDRLFDEKKFEQALAYYESIIGKNPELYILNKSIGSCYFGIENYEKAIESYLKVYEKQPEDFDIINAIANSYNNMNQLDQAVEWYRKMPLSSIKDIDTAYNAGVLLFNSGNAEESIAYFQKAVAIAPQFGDAFYQLGIALAALNRANEAVEALKKFVALSPDSPNADTAKGIIETLEKKEF